METFAIVALFVFGVGIFMSIFIRPSKQNKKDQPHKPTTEEFDKVMKMLMTHGVISVTEYVKIYNGGRPFTKKK